MQSRYRVLFAGLLLAAQVANVSCSQLPKSGNGNHTAPVPSANESTSGANLTLPTPEYTYKVVHTYPHDPGAFTEGLFYSDGFLYESTGLNGQSSLRKVDLQTGRVLQQETLGAEYFGEGITLFGSEIIQLTWQNHQGFVYDGNTFELVRNFDYETEGWGITSDGKHLIMSDGTSTLHILDPQNFENIGDISVQDKGNLIENLNELEYVNGLIYANVWNSDNIAIIDPGSGRVNGWVNLTGLLPAQSGGKKVDVLNGIAYDAEHDRLFVTGKLWPTLFEIKLVRTR